MESTDLLVVRQIAIHRIQSRAHRRLRDIAGDERRDVAAAVADQNDVLCAGKQIQELLLDWFRGDIVAGIENNQVFDAPDDAPIPCGIYLALIAGVEPAVTKDTRGFFGAVPVARKKIWAADEDFLAFAENHFHPGDGRTDAAGLDMPARVVQRADACRFRQAVALQNADTQHIEKKLRVPGQRRGATDEGAEMCSEARADFREDQEAGDGAVERIRKLMPAVRMPQKTLPGFFKDPQRKAAAAAQIVFHASPDTFEQGRHIQEIVGRGQADLIGKLVEVGGKRQQAAARETRKGENPRGGEIKGQVMKDAIGLGGRAHQLVEALRGARKHVIEIRDGEANTFGFTRRTRRVDDCDQVLRLA